MSLFNFRFGISTWQKFKSKLKINSKTWFFSQNLILFQFCLSQFNPIVWTRVIGGIRYHNFWFQSSATYITEPKMTLILAVIDMGDSYNSHIFLFHWFDFILSAMYEFEWSTCTFALKIKLLFLAPFLVAKRKIQQHSIPLSNALGAYSSDNILYPRLVFP